MATGIKVRSGGIDVDLDDWFDPYLQGTKPGLTGYNVAGFGDLRDRYAPLVYGTKAALTNYSVAGVGDLRELFAAKGTAKYTTPDNGNAYNSGHPLAVGQSGRAGIRMYVSSLAPLQYTVTDNGGSSGVGVRTFAVPGGATYFKALLTFLSGTAAETVVQTTAYTKMAALNDTMASILSALQSHNVGTITGTYRCALAFSVNGVSDAFTGSTTWTWDTDASA